MLSLCEDDVGQKGGIQGCQGASQVSAKKRGRPRMQYHEFASDGCRLTCAPFPSTLVPSLVFDISASFLCFPDS